LTVTITVIHMAYMLVYEKWAFVKLSGTADFIRLKYIDTWGFFYVKE